ncbi:MULTISPECIES: MFS transporter [unclassified Sphingomonas]|uniref:MFS transporter n=1 Tax=unclassified Sphingomonas TaxID=196159 RepID=UPI001F5961F4|nr:MULTISPECIES: MFS transporter [unclassified Sphingomonas]
MDFRQGIGLLGIVLAAIAAQLNDQVLSIALPDVAGGMGLSMDQASWLRTLFVTGQVVGMCMAPSLGIAFSFRRFALFAILMNLVPTLLMALGGGVAPVLILRLIQGLASGFTIPLLMTVALRVLGPEVRLYGLAVYAMTATLTPNLATSFAALWVDGLRDYHWIFLQPLPFCTLAAACVWWGMEQEPPQYDRLRRFDWTGVALVAAGFGSLTIVLEQGDRFDWFNSPLIAILALVSVVSLPLLVIVERYAPLPLMRFDLLARRNFAYPVIVLIVFLIVSLSASQVPLTFLEQVRGLRPVQIHQLSLGVAASQIVLLPLTAVLLDHRHVDARWVNAVGFASILFACYLDAHVTSAWGPQQFILGEAFQALGFAFVVMPLLMIATNTIKPEEGPYGSALVNTPRAVAEAIGVWAIALIGRWRGELHRVRLTDLLGQNRLVLEQLGVLPRDTQGPAARTVYAALDRELERQVTTLTTIDTYAIMGLLAIALMIALAVIPTRTYPPRIALAKQ